MSVKIFILMLLALLPWVAFADTGCRVVEYAERFEAICDGPLSKLQAANTAAPAHEQTSMTGEINDIHAPDTAKSNVSAGTELTIPMVSGSVSRGWRRPHATDISDARTARVVLIQELRQKDAGTQAASQ